MKPEIRGWNDIADLDFIEPVEALNAMLPEVSEKSDINVFFAVLETLKTTTWLRLTEFCGTWCRYTQGHRRT